MTTRLAPGDSDAVRAALDAWIAGVEQGDPAIVAQAMAPDDDLEYIGFQASDWLIGWPAVKAALEAQAAAVKDIRITVAETRIHALRGGQAAYATSQWVIAGDIGGQHITMPLRCSWVLEKRGDGWLLVHFHKSMAAG